jgi:DNA mismatch repair protein MutS2
LRVRAKYRDVRKRNRGDRRSDEAKERRKEIKPSERRLASEVANPGLELDLRGNRVEEAIAKLVRYVDAAYLSGLPFGRIIHGKGTGKLREAVRDYLRQHALISKVTGAEANEGGSGVTVIHLAPQT